MANDLDLLNETCPLVSNLVAERCMFSGKNSSSSCLAICLREDSWVGNRL